MLAALLVGILIIAIAVESALRQTDEIRLERTSYGEEATEYSLQVSDGQDPGLEIQIEVPAVEYTEPELKEQFQNGFQYLEAQMLGDNITSDMVKQNLNLEKRFRKAVSGFNGAVMTMNCWKTMERSIIRH